MSQPTWHSRLPDRVRDPVFEAMNCSLPVDSRLFREEIAATKAHACALRKAGVYSDEECALVRASLCRIEDEIASGELPTAGVEDIHTLVENRLTELAGSAGAKIQTGRSRNEQTVTAQRLFLKNALKALSASVSNLQAAAISVAENSVAVLMPGFTHSRPAQPLSFAHCMCALFFGLERDKGRLQGALSRADLSPAGSGALAGSGFPIDREAVAGELGFAGITDNSLDAVSDRDCQLETLCALSILMVRLSRFAEDMVLWSSPAYGFVELGDTWCTSSSLMPQKKNPDSMELVRGKSGRVISDLVSLLVTCKGLPGGYHKDLQEDKGPLFDAVDTALSCTHVCAGVLRSLKLDEAKMRAAITPDCMATDAADRLVEAGVPFRDAYAEIASGFASGGKKRAARSRKAGAPGPEESVSRRDLPGGTGTNSVLAQIAKARNILGS